MKNAYVPGSLILLVAWELIGQLALIGDGAFPPLSDIAVRFWQDRDDYRGHVAATLYGSGLGFLIGNGIAIAAGMIFTLFPVTLRLSRGLNIALFAIPPIALTPILALLLSGMAPRVVLAALGCYFVTMTATVIGLSQYDERAADVVRAYGGGRLRILLKIQIRQALPVILGGLQIAAPNAVLGAILAEFGGGQRWGLGSYLLGSLGRADPARLWGIGLVATAIAGLAYGFFALISRRAIRGSRGVSLSNAATPPIPSVGTTTIQRLILLLGSITLPLFIWWVFIRLLNVPDMIGKTPLGVVNYLFLSSGASAAQARLIEALGQTLPMTFLGMLTGLSAAFALAMSTRLFPVLTRVFMPVALITQTMPLVALTPLLILILGRGNSLTLWITISVTFFPAFVTIVQGLSLVPQSALDVTRAYGASTIKELRLVAVPASLPYVFAATRLTVPRALLGVMIAEWLATGKGLGNLLNQSRGYLDYGMIWTVAVVSVLLSIGFYQMVVYVERFVLHRMGMRSTE
ncbi:MAG: ABC transporter permease [Granulosicoccus sp.]